MLNPLTGEHYKGTGGDGGGGWGGGHDRSYVATMSEYVLQGKCQQCP